MNRKSDNHKPVVYRLINEELGADFGRVSFNGKFVFELAPNVDFDTWKQVGIIPLDGDKRRVEVANDLFYFLNSRLPKHLRNSSPEVKMEYINKTGLRVASDSFKLERTI
ncbi:MAG: hypothetical protein WBO92_04255 [Candidatus Moraniibacteriota bacterium]